MHMLFTDCQWRAVSQGLPLRSTMRGFINLRDWGGAIDRIHRAYKVKRRETPDRE